MLFCRPITVTQQKTPLFYGRSIGRPLSLAKKTLLNTLLPQLLWDPCKALPSSTWLEIGFGTGDHLLQRLAMWPETHFIGVEVFQQGISHFLANLPKEHQKRVHLFPNNVHELIPQLKTASIEGIFLLFPDPWPKKKHHKRRLLQDDFVQACHRILKPQGQMLVGSDDHDLLFWMQEQLAKVFDPLKTATIGAWPWPTTKYMLKAQARGKLCGHMCWRKA